MNSSGSAALRRIAHRLVASDPGLVRLFEALRTLVSIGTAVTAVTLANHGAPALFGATIIAGIVAWESSIAVTDARLRDRQATTLLGAIPALLGTVLCSAVSGNKLLLDGCFIALVFAAVYVRRFGPRWTVFGWLATITYFVTVFAGLQNVPFVHVLGAVATGTLSAFAVRFVVFRPSAGLTSRLMLYAFEARIRLLVDEVIGSLRGRRRARVRVRASLGALSDTALAIDAQLVARDGADERSRVVVFDAQLAAESLAAHALRSGGSARVRDIVPLLQLVQADRLDEAREAAASHAAASNDALLAALIDVIDGMRRMRAAVAWRRTHAGGGDAATAPVAGSVLPDVSSRQAVQVTAAVACAIVLGELVSPDRWYWSVLAAFLVFSGTASSGETLRRAWRRIAGTALGVLVAVTFGGLFAHNPEADVTLVFASLFAAVYFLKYDYGFTMFFVTIMLATLFSLLGRFSDQLLFTRLSETVLGAVLGGLAAVVIAPARTRDVARDAAALALDAAAGVVCASVAQLTGETWPVAPVQAVRALDARIRDFGLRARPLLSPATMWRGHREVQRWSVALNACGLYGRRLARMAGASRGASMSATTIAALRASERELLAGIERASAALRVDARREPERMNGEKRGAETELTPAGALLERLRHSVEKMSV